MKKPKNVRRFIVSMFAIIVIAVSFIGCDGAVTPSVESTGEGTSGVDLGSAANYVILAKSGVTTSPASIITGNMGVSPLATSYFTGFSETLDISGTFATSDQVTGNLYAANMTSPTPSILTTAVEDMQTAYNFAAGRTNPDGLNLYSGAIGGKTLAPGLYKWTSGVDISGTNLAINGGENDTWIFQVAGNLTLASAIEVTLSGGALAENIVWQVAGNVTMGAGSHLKGIVLCKTNIAMQSLASIDGRLLAQTEVTLIQNTITQPTL